MNKARSRIITKDGKTFYIQRHYMDYWRCITADQSIDNLNYPEVNGSFYVVFGSLQDAHEYMKEWFMGETE